MERLTYRFGENNEYANFVSLSREGWYQYRASCEGAKRLAAYEDLNRTPEELAADLARLAGYDRQIQSGELVKKEDYITKEDAEKLRGEIEEINKRVDGWDFFTKHGIELEKQADEICEMLEAKERGELERVVKCEECAYLGGCISQCIPAALNWGYCSRGERKE